MRLTVFVAATAFALLSSPALAGVFTDDLSRCIVEKSSDNDKTQMMRWMFAALTRDPALADLAHVTQPERDKLNKSMATIYSRLMLVDCRSQAIAALKNEGLAALGESGRVLGGAAARSLMSSPASEQEIAKFGDFMDKDAWDALGKEAGANIGSK